MGKIRTHTIQVIEKIKFHTSQIRILIKMKQLLTKSLTFDSFCNDMYLSYTCPFYCEINVS